jgi:hypothetical protein
MEIRDYSLVGHERKDVRPYTGPASPEQRAEALEKQISKLNEKLFDLEMDYEIELESSRPRGLVRKYEQISRLKNRIEEREIELQTIITDLTKEVK